MPPSRDLYTIKGENRVKSERRPGGQPGHKASNYEYKVADEVIDCKIEVCKCGQKLEERETYTREQRIEIPPIKAYVKEYRRWHGYCKVCKRKRVASLPQGVACDILGPQAKTIISYLNGYYHNSKPDVQAIMGELFNTRVSLGLISKTAELVKKYERNPIDFRGKKN